MTRCYSTVPARKMKMATPPSGWQPRSNPWIIAASVMLATFMEVLDTSVDMVPVVKVT
jgi:hypothetical protein